MMITSSTGVPIEVEIHDIHPKRDNSVSAADAVENGLAERILIGSLQLHNYDFGAKPGMSNQFGVLFKSDKVTKFTIPSGGVHKHTGYIQYKKFFTGNVTDNAETNVHGWTRKVMIVAKPYPVHTNTGTDYTNDPISAPKFRLDIATSYNIQWRYSTTTKSEVKVQNLSYN